MFYRSTSRVKSEVRNRTTEITISLFSAFTKWFVRIYMAFNKNPVTSNMNLKLLFLLLKMILFKFEYWLSWPWSVWFHIWSKSRYNKHNKISVLVYVDQIWTASSKLQEAAKISHNILVEKLKKAENDLARFKRKWRKY